MRGCSAGTAAVCGLHDRQGDCECAKRIAVVKAKRKARRTGPLDAYEIYLAKSRAWFVDVSGTSDGRHLPRTSPYPEVRGVEAGWLSAADVHRPDPRWNWHSG